MKVAARPEHPRDLDLASLERIPADQVRLLWANDWWDGLVEGIAEWRGRRCLALVLDWEQFGAPDEHRRWVLYALTPEQLSVEDRWHALFVRHVGSHFTFTSHVADDAREGGNPDAFYRPYQAEYRPPTLSADQAVGVIDDYVTAG